MGWTAIRIWEHELKADGDAVLRKVMVQLRTRSGGKDA